jgi:hypothetical protein
MTALTTTEILAVCSDVSTAKIVDLRKWADELGVAKNGSKFDIATRIVARIQPREAAAKDAKSDTAVKAPRKVRMQVVRADDTAHIGRLAGRCGSRPTRPLLLPPFGRVGLLSHQPTDQGERIP